VCLFDFMIACRFHVAWCSTLCRNRVVNRKSKELAKIIIFRFSARTRHPNLRVVLIFTRHLYNSSRTKIVRKSLSVRPNILTIVKDRLAGGGGGGASVKSAPPVEHVSVASAKIDQSDSKVEEILVEEPVAEKPPSQDLQAFDPIRTFLL